MKTTGNDESTSNQFQPAHRQNSRDRLMNRTQTWRSTALGVTLVAGYLAYCRLEPWLNRQRAISEAAARIVAQQDLLAHYEAATVAINTALRAGLASDPSLARIRVGLMHAPATRENLPLLRWDVTHSLTKPGHVVGPLATDLHVSDWSDYLGKLLANKCNQTKVVVTNVEAAMARAREMNMQGFIACPITTAKGELVGAVFGSWDIGDPEPPDLAATEAVVRQVADKIAAAVPLER
jgi:hypothetical protein